MLLANHFQKKSQARACHAFVLMTYNFNARKKRWLCVFNLAYKRNMAHRYYVAAHNHPNPNGHQDHGRSTHSVLRHMKPHDGLFVIVLTCVGLPKSHSKKTQIVRVGFVVEHTIMIGRVARLRIPGNLEGFSLRNKIFLQTFFTT